MDSYEVQMAILGIQDLSDGLIRNVFDTTDCVDASEFATHYKEISGALKLIYGITSMLAENIVDN